MKKNKKELIFLVAFIIIFVILRSIHYTDFVNWSGDQASCGLDALNIMRTKKLVLIGPQISANYQGHFIFQGPLITYFFLFFLLLGGWDPVKASYLFMIFACLMIIPLFYGVKKLINHKAAWLAVIIYSLIPYYVNYTRFLWNSTLQLSLLPILIFLMGLYKEKKQPFFFFILSIWVGVLLQFHYQFFLIILSLFLYYFFVKKISFFNFFLYFLGIAIGFSPLIIFELKHNFYHVKTFILFFKNWRSLDAPGGLSMPHYYITLSFLSIIALLGILKKQVKKIPFSYFVFFCVFLIVYDLYLFLPVPRQAFWAPATPWNYKTELKIYQLIRATKIKTDFNVANLAYYDTKATVIKYFLKRDGYQINYDDYYQNKYLFVISEGEKYKNALSYEVAFFKPRRLLKSWEINEKFKMYLFERVSS